MEEPIRFIQDDIEAMAGNKIHSTIASNLGAMCSMRFIYRTGCTVNIEGLKYYLSELDDKYYIPDVIINCTNMIDYKDGVTGKCTFIAEVLSNSTSKIDIGEKKHNYALCGVEEYWIINPDKKTVYVNILDGTDYNSIIYMYDGVHDVIIKLHHWPEIEISLKYLFYVTENRKLKR